METKPKKVQSFFKKFLAGVVIGIGGILPGVSGGILAVAMGLYRRMLEAVYTFFKAPKENFLFLLPIALGGVAGLLGTALFLEPLMNTYQDQMMFLFIGLVLGGVPGLWKEGTAGTGFRARYLIATVLGAALILVLTLVCGGKDGGLTLSLNFLTAMLCGGVIAIGTVIPGISTSFILMFLGLYSPMLSALNRFNIPMLLGAGIGIVAVALLLIRSVRAVFNRFPNYAYFAVMGFLCASMVPIFPGFSGSLTDLLNIALLVGGFAAAYFMERALNRLDSAQPKEDGSESETPKA